MSSGIGVASSTIIGQQIGKGDVKVAMEFYKVIKLNSVIIIGHLCLLLYVFKAQILVAITTIDSVIVNCSKVLWICCFTSFLEMHKAVLKGVVRGLALQKQALYIHLLGNWLVNFGMIYFFCVKLQFKLEGLWMAKIFMEATIVIG